MRIHGNAEPPVLRADQRASPLCFCQEELLVRREPIDRRFGALAFAGPLVSAVRQVYSAQVTQRLTRDQFALQVQTRLYEVAVILFGGAAGARLEVGVVRRGPPILELSVCRELCALGVDSVRDFMPDAYPNRTVVDGIQALRVESRWLQI